jgi:hypothetical protein
MSILAGRHRRPAANKFYWFRAAGFGLKLNLIFRIENWLMLFTSRFRALTFSCSRLQNLYPLDGATAQGIPATVCRILCRTCAVEDVS